MGIISKQVETACLGAGMVGPSGILKGKALGQALEIWLRACTVSCMGVGLLGAGVGTLSVLGNAGAVSVGGVYGKEWRPAIINGVFSLPYQVTGPCGVGVGVANVIGFVGDLGLLKGTLRASYAGFGLEAGDLEIDSVCESIYNGFLTATGTGAIAGAPAVIPPVSGALPFSALFIV